MSLSISNRPRRFLGAFTHDLAAVSSEPYEPAPRGRLEGPTKLIAFNPRIGQTTYAIPIRSMYARARLPDSASHSLGARGRCLSIVALQEPCIAARQFDPPSHGTKCVVVHTGVGDLH